MTNGGAKHAFISHVHEDQEAVDALCGVLDAAQVPYWRDRNDLAPGDAWKVKIRAAIQEGSLVFLACFSDQSKAKDSSFMNDEIATAVDEFRKMPPGRTWLIPIRFDDGPLPVWDLGAGRTLTDLNFVDLFGPGHAKNAIRLVVRIRELMGDEHVDAATALAAVDQTTPGARVEALRRLTKEMVPDPERRIELDDLVKQEARRVLELLSDPGAVAGPLEGSNEEQLVRVARLGQQYEHAALPFCASVQVAARWAGPEAMTTWALPIRSFVVAANRTQSGTTALLSLRHVPGLLAIMAAAIACVSGERWENLRILIADQTARGRYDNRDVPMLETTYPWTAFDPAEVVGKIMAQAAITGVAIEEAVKQPPNFRTAPSEWMLAALRPMFTDQWPEADTYDREFDRAEVMLGLLAQDAAAVRSAADPSGGRFARSYWLGRSAWRAHQGYGHTVNDFAAQLEQQGDRWGPLRAGLFGGRGDRAAAALDGYREQFDAFGSRNAF